MGRQKGQKSGGKKKGGTAGVSLGALLDKHWEQRHWEAYVTLFLRHQGKALKLDAAQRLDAALYNCLTDALFVRRDIPAVEMAVRIILSSNGESLPLSTETRHCAAVAQAMLDYRQHGYAGDMPCPSSPAYAALRAYVAAPPKVDAPRTKECERAAALLGKMAKQYAALPEAKSSAAYTHWHKNARALADLLPQEPVFGMLAGLTGLIRQLKDAGHPLREPLVAVLVFRQALTAKVNLLDGNCPPGIAALMHIFLCMGQQCYGEHWASAVRVVMYDYLPENCFAPREKAQLSALGKITSGFTLSKSVHFALHALLAQRTLWNDREYFALGCLCLAAESTHTASLLFSEKIASLLEDLVLLLPIVRPQQSAPEILVSTLSSFVMTQAHMVSPKVIPLLHHFPPSTLLMLMAGLLLRKQACNLEGLARQAGMSLPLRIFSGEAEQLSMVLSELPLRILTSLLSALTPESRAALCDAVLKDMLDESLLLCEEDASLRDQAWRVMNAEYRNFFLAHLTSTNSLRALLALCGDAPFTLAPARPMGNAFLDFLTQHAQPLVIMRWLCQWKGADMELFKPMYTTLQGYIFDTRQWQQVLEVLNAMPASLCYAAADFVLRRWEKSKCGDPSFKYFRKQLKLMSENNGGLFRTL